MPLASINGVQIYYQITGEGFPLVLCHEFAGSHESWEEQVRFFSSRYSVITYNARGYPPSEVPTELDAYSQEQHVEDLYGLLNHLGIDEAYICGLSMGANMALHFGILHPEKARALVVAGGGYGGTERDKFRLQSLENAKIIESGGMDAFSDYARGPARVQLFRKNPIAWEKFAKLFADHSALGSSLTLRGVQASRPTVNDLEEGMRKLNIPTLILVGDEDDLSVEPSLFMKRCIRKSGLFVFPQTGHTINLEEPELFDGAILNFLIACESGSWAERDASSGMP